MVKKVIIRVVVTISLLLNLSSFSSFVIGEREKADSYNSNSTCQQFSDFSGFQIAINSSYITSTKTTTDVMMSITTGAFEEIQSEVYDLTFDEITNVTEFKFEVTFDFNYTGQMLAFIYVIVGSNYYENGSYDDNMHYICKIGIQDSWDASGGVFVLAAYPNNVYDRYISSYGSITSSNTYTAFISRTYDTLACMMKEDSLVKFSKEWSVSEGLTRPINFVRLFFIANPIYTAETFVDYNTIDLKLNGLPIKTITETITVILPSINLFAVIICLVLSLIVFRGVNHINVKKK